MRKRMNKVISGISAAALVFGSVSSYVAFAAAADATKVPVGYNGLTLSANGDGDIYGVSMTVDQLKALKFSDADANVGRTTEGYYAGFYVDAMNTGKNGGNATYKKAYTYVADLEDATIKGLTYDAGDSTDGQFWPCFKKSYLSPTGRDSVPYLVYAIEATYDNSEVKYYYIAVNWKALPEDFTFGDAANCTGTHDTDTPCTICGNVKYGIDVDDDIENGTVAVTPTSALPGEKVAIETDPAADYELDEYVVTDKDGNDVTVNEDGTFTMPAGDVTVSATFKQTEYTVTVDAATNGTVTISPYKAAAGATVTITATPDSGYVLENLNVFKNSTFYGTTKQSDGTYTFTMPASDVTITAEFAREYAITILDVDGVRDALLSVTKATAGTEIAVTVNPATGYAVEKITYTVGGGEPVEITGGNFVMPAGDVQIKPVVTRLAPDEYSVTVSSTDTNGTVTVDKTSATEGAEITVTATPKEGYELEAITVMNGTEKVTVTNGKFTMPAGNVTVSATFKEVPNENKPGDDENKPGDDENKPGDDENKPGDDENKPGDNENKPGDDSDKPADGDNKPADDDNKPADDNNVPGGSDKDDDGNGGNSGDGDGDNHETGIALAIAPVVLAAGVVAVVTFKKKR